MMTREPVQIFEIDVPYCSLTYGTSPCTASLSLANPAKCFNMYRGCQDKDNYSATTITLRFATSINGLLKSEQIYPVMQGEIMGGAMEINVGGVDERLGPLGRRETLTVQLKDFQDNDTQLDKYQSERISGAALFSGVGYVPLTQGTFLSRLLSRWPYWKDAPGRVRDGYVGDALSAFTTRNYVISKVGGPNASGSWAFEIRDILDLVSEERFVPNQSGGTLPADIDETELAVFDIVPTGEGADYPASGRLSIGNEIMTYTRSGDTFTITERGVDRSEASSHTKGDTVQECYRVEDGLLDEVIEDVMVNYAKVDASFIPTSDWRDEVGTWLAGLRITRTIAKPEKTTDVIASLLRLGVFCWWDRENQEVKLRANRPVGPGETLQEFVDLDDFLEGSFAKTELEGRRITDVIFRHGLIDPTQNVNDKENYDRAIVASDSAASSDNEYGKNSIYEVFSPWFDTGDDTQALAIAFRLLYRFRNTPVQMSAILDISRYDDLTPGSPVKITTRLVQNDDGSQPDAQYQILSAQKMRNNRVEAVFESYEHAGRFGTITENSRPDYGSSTEAQIAAGTYLVDETTLLFADGTGSYVLF